MKTGLLVNVPVLEGVLAGLSDDFEISQILDERERAGFLKSNGAAIEAVLTNGSKGGIPAYRPKRVLSNLLPCTQAAKPSR